jgi:uncharacterized protein (TIGR02453 family)
MEEGGMAFTGFGRGAQRFFGELAERNEREWFEANRGRYERELLEPAVAFVEALGPRLAKLFAHLNFGTQRNGTGSIMRIHRDTRFGADKSPYKLNLGIVFWIGPGKKVELPCCYLHIEEKSAFFYAGQHMFQKPILERYRTAAADSRSGAALGKALAATAKVGLEIYEEPAFKRLPKGIAADHPRAKLLRHAGLGVGEALPAKLLASAALVDSCADAAKRAKPLVDWLVALNG